MSINITWDVNDILSLRPDLTDDEANNVLKELALVYDKEVGINKQLVLNIAESLYSVERLKILKTYSVGVGRRIIQKIIIEIDAYSESDAEKEVLRLIRGEEFREKPFTTTAITGEFITDIHEKKIN